MNQTTEADDDRAIRLAQEALTHPKKERWAFLKRACQGDAALFEQAWKMVRDEELMGSFLKSPVAGRFDPPDLFEPGQLLTDRFRIIREIGSGGMGVVWEAYDELLERRVAIKCAKPGFSQQLRPEVRHAREISHANVCKLFDIHTTATPLGRADFACMEFIDGKTLTERLSEGPIPKKERLAIALQICDGLASAHSHGVVHGDLKSLNIMLTTGPNGAVRAVIMDFGLARAPESRGEGEETKMLAGTLAYMAPELPKTCQSSVAADIYALGVIFWEMLSGKQPGDLPVTSAKVTGNSKPVYKAPKGFGRWDHVLACCLDENPAHRFAAANDVATALKPPRSRKWFLVAAAALLLAIVTGDIAYIMASLPEQTVRLAALPFEISRKGFNSYAVTKETLSGLSGLSGDKHTDFTFIPFSKVLSNHVDTLDKASKLLGATHILRVAFDVKARSIFIHTFLIDSKHGSVTKAWSAEYRPAEMKYVPRAMAGFVN